MVGLSSAALILIWFNTALNVFLLVDDILTFFWVWAELAPSLLRDGRNHVFYRALCGSWCLVFIFRFSINLIGMVLNRNWWLLDTWPIDVNLNNVIYAYLVAGEFIDVFITFVWQIIKLKHSWRFWSKKAYLLGARHYCEIVPSAAMNAAGGFKALLVVSPTATSENLWKELGNILRETYVLVFISWSYCWAACSFNKTLTFELCTVILEII